MACDLAGTPRTDIHAQASGEAHLVSFGPDASPERHIVFHPNDFDETLPAPWEWDGPCCEAAEAVVGCRGGRLSVLSRGRMTTQGPADEPRPLRQVHQVRELTE